MIHSPWLRATRLQLHTIGFTPLLLGNIAAWHEHGYFSWPRFGLSVLIGLLIHLVTAFVNDVADIRTDKANRSRTPFSGGSGVVVDGELSRSEQKAALRLLHRSSEPRQCLSRTQGHMLESDTRTQRRPYCQEP